MRFWRALSAAFLLSGFSGYCALASAQTLTSVRYSVDGDRVRIVIDASAPCDYSVSRHVGPDRIAINIRNARAGRSLDSITIGTGGVKRARVNRLSWGTQVVLDLDAPTTWTDFRLSAAQNRSHRIVVDVTASTSGSGSGGSGVVARHRAEPDVARAGLRDIVVAIDAGHGGKDRGTTGHKLVEKTLTLDLAHRVAVEIERHPGFAAVLTRDHDLYLDLPERNELARQGNADAFVSLHFNWAPKRSARGTEVFFVSPAGAEVSARHVLSNPDRAAHDYGVVSAEPDLLHMLVDLNQQNVLARSEALAESILQSFNRADLMPTRAVRQKSFAVLRNISMPSVLVEAGFLSNSEDARIIKTEAGRDLIAAAIGRGVVKYLSANSPRRVPGESYVVHRVRRGDTLWKISREYNTSISRIQETNRLESSVLRVGQELIVSRNH